MGEIGRGSRALREATSFLPKATSWLVVVLVLVLTDTQLMARIGTGTADTSWLVSPLEFH